MAITVNSNVEYHIFSSMPDIRADVAFPFVTFNSLVTAKVECCLKVFEEI
jgi:hypothetical protein